MGDGVCSCSNLSANAELFSKVILTIYHFFKNLIIKAIPASVRNFEMYKKENVPLLPRDLSPETTLVNFLIYIYFNMDVYMKYLFFPLSNIDIYF